MRGAADLGDAKVSAKVSGSARPFVQAGLGTPSPNVRIENRVSGKTPAKR